MLTTPIDVGALPYFAAGWVSVQDIAAQFAAGLLSPAPDERILDACAAPGGKACHILEQQPQLTELVAMDISESRQQRIHENRERLGLPMTLLVGDASAPPESLLRESFDAILADVPCSATGVIRRNGRQNSAAGGRHHAFCRSAVQHTAGAVATIETWRTASLVTCSVLREENDDVITRFKGTM